MPERIRCEGAPRDLGLDQGRASGAQLRALRRLLDGGRGGRLPARISASAREHHRWAERVERDMSRHFPHLAERVAGLARGAGVSRRTLVGGLVWEIGVLDAGVFRCGGGVSLGAVPQRTGAGPLLAKTIDLPRRLAADLCVRESAPEGGHRSVELTLPWLPGGLAGVNEHGLAAAVSTIPGRDVHASECAAPAVLLVQECLQRCDAVASAVEWCERRPAGGIASILLADRGGALACVEVAGRERRVREPSEGLVLGAMRATVRTAVDKDCRAPGRLHPERLLEVLSSHGSDARGSDDSPCRHGEARATAAALWIDPAQRRLGLRRGLPCTARAEDLEIHGA